MTIGSHVHDGPGGARHSGDREVQLVTDTEYKWSWKCESLPFTSLLFSVAQFSRKGFNRSQ